MDFTAIQQVIEARTPERSAQTLRSAVWWTLVAIAGFLIVDSAIFRSGWYSKYLSPDSTTGEVEYHLLWLNRMPPAKTPSIVVVGDSRIAEGFSSRVANGATGGGINFVNLGMPGATPRVWYYTLRDADPARNRFSVIAIMLDQYSDQDAGEEGQNRTPDMNYLAQRLRLSDCWDFAQSWDDAALRKTALTGCLFPGTRLRSDVADFLSNIRLRLRRASDWRNNGARYQSDYTGIPMDLTGLWVDWPTRTIHFPAGLTNQQTETIRTAVLPHPEPQTGALTRYRQRWLGGITDLYRNSSTRIVFFEIPRAPVPVPDAKEPARFVNSVVARPQVSVLPENAFRELEHPEVFADGYHLNQKGRVVFSALLAHTLQAEAAPAQRR